MSCGCQQFLLAEGELENPQMGTVAAVFVKLQLKKELRQIFTPAKNLTMVCMCEISLQKLPISYDA